MSDTGNLIDFDIIEDHKENIQSLPGGRSARALASMFSPSLQTPTPSDTRNLNHAIRREYEVELENISESDDPLDIYDRYVRWTLDAYPSAQATPSSQLLPLLERATKAFLNSAQYKNDPRYLKLWLSYIRFFSDSPREMFAFLARNGIGEGLALFYEEFAAWLEGAGRWLQAEEIYRMGIDNEARPTARLQRKFGEFQQRFAQRPENSDEPSSPVLPTVRPALAAKLDPFSIVARDPQAPEVNSGIGGQSAKNGRPKLRVFSDADDVAPAIASGGDTQGWQSITSLVERKKENIIEPKPWVGETLKAGGKKSINKLEVFKDESLPCLSCIQVTDPAQHQVTINQKGRTERIFVNLEAVYPTPDLIGTELSIEELRAGHRGWLSKVWEPEIITRKSRQESSASQENARYSNIDTDEAIKPVIEKLTIAHDPILLDENGRAKENSREGRGRRMKIKEVNETQIIKAKLSSPSGPKISKRKSKEQTMTLHTKAATDDIYDLFNQPLQVIDKEQEDEESSDDDDTTDGEYTSGGESTGTGRLVTASEVEDDETSDVKSMSEWSEFTARKHIPYVENENETDNPQASGFTDAVKEQEEFSDAFEAEYPSMACSNNITTENPEISTPTLPELPCSTGPTSVPISHEDFEHPTRSYRDLVQISQNRLPFMTPIAEKTESSLSTATLMPTKGYFDVKTPSKDASKNQSSFLDVHEMSPFQEITPQNLNNDKIVRPLLNKPKSANNIIPISANANANGGLLVREVKEIASKGPIIKDAQCNPVDPYLHETILSNIHPPLQSYHGFFRYIDERRSKSGEIKKYAKAVLKISRNTSDKTTTKLTIPPILQFPAIDRKYMVKRELGSGAFAPVYLIENVAHEACELEKNSPKKARMCKFSIDTCGRKSFEALKMEEPPSAWEFYIMREAKHRLGVSRAAESIVNVYEMHLYQDECYLIEEYREQGTLLSVINAAKSGPGVLDEILVIFFAIELFRTIEALHAKGILHGDLKADNCLVRFDPISGSEVWGSKYRRDGAAGWNKKGISLIDFGRGIDMKAFVPNVQFIADWKSCPQDCAEIREMRPWTYQIDYHGLAGILHSMLFGRYIETVADNKSGIGPGAKKTWRIKENLKRYWQTEIWSEAFDLLLNAPSHVQGEDRARMPVNRGLKTCREKMEVWLEANSEKGVGLQATIRKLEAQLVQKR